MSFLNIIFSRIFFGHRQTVDTLRLLEEARVMEENAQFNEALVCCNRAICLEPSMAQAHLLKGNLLLAMEDSEGALKAYAETLAHEPQNAKAHFNQGIIHYQLNDYEKALEAFRLAIVNNPEFVEAEISLGCVHEDMGQDNEAINCYLRAIALNPHNAESYFNLALLQNKLGQHKEAEASYQQSISYNPDFAEAHNNLACAFKDAGRVEEAEAHYRKVIALKPDKFEAYNNLLFCLATQNNYEEAKHVISLAITANMPAEKLAQMSAVLQTVGMLTEAEQVAQACIACSFNADAEYLQLAYRTLALSTRRRGDYIKAVNYFLTAWRLNPSDLLTKQLFAQSLSDVVLQQPSEEIKRFLCDALKVPYTYPKVLSNVIGGVLCDDPLFGKIFNLVINQKLRDIDAWQAIAKLNIEDLSENDLLLAFLSTSCCSSIDLEEVLTALRASLLHIALSNPNRMSNPRVLSLLCAMAQHCYIGQFIFFVSPAEQSWIDDMAAGLQPNTSTLPWELALLAMYQPLSEIPGIDTLLGQNLPETLQAVIVSQVIEPRTEDALRAKIPRLTAIDNEISQAVQKQYEEHPYPRWIAMPPIGIQPLSIVMRGYFPLRNFDTSRDSGPIEVLVAGCGTGQHPLGVAVQNSNVLAVDLSLNSLAYAQRKTHEKKVENICFGQADILKLNSLDKQFDLIECCGVLHHLDKPIEGWRVLTNLLKPGGFMKIGLYSELARQPVVEARRLIREWGVPPTNEGIRNCRVRFKRETQTGVLHDILTWGDFFSMSDCRDLIFHVQEHRFTIPAIKNAIDELGLEFLGFLFNNSNVANAYKQRFPDDRLQCDLDAWNRFEQEFPETFCEMYNFMLYKPK